MRKIEENRENTKNEVISRASDHLIKVISSLKFHNMKFPLPNFCRIFTHISKIWWGILNLVTLEIIKTIEHIY